MVTVLGRDGHLAIIVGDGLHVTSAHCRNKTWPEFLGSYWFATITWPTVGLWFAAALREGATPLRACHAISSRALIGSGSWVCFLIGCRQTRNPSQPPYYQLTWVSRQILVRYNHDAWLSSSSEGATALRACNVISSRSLIGTEKQTSLF